MILNAALDLKHMNLHSLADSELEEAARPIYLRIIRVRTQAITQRSVKILVTNY